MKVILLAISALVMNQASARDLTCSQVEVTGNHYVQVKAADGRLINYTDTQGTVVPGSINCKTDVAAASRALAECNSVITKYECKIETVTPSFKGEKPRTASEVESSKPFTQVRLASNSFPQSILPNPVFDNLPACEAAMNKKIIEAIISAKKQQFQLIVGDPSARERFEQYQQNKPYVKDF